MGNHHGANMLPTPIAWAFLEPEEVRAWPTTAKVFHVVFLIFDEITQLDFSGPAQVLCRIPGAVVHTAAKAVKPIATDSGYSILPSTSRQSVRVSPSTLTATGAISSPFEEQRRLLFRTFLPTHVELRAHHRPLEIELKIQFDLRNEPVGRTIILAADGGGIAGGNRGVGFLNI